MEEVERESKRKVRGDEEIEREKKKRQAQRNRWEIMEKIGLVKETVWKEKRGKREGGKERNISSL